MEVLMNRKNTKILALSLCGAICISNVGCSNISKDETKKNVESNTDITNIKDIRTVKVNQDQAMLRFTTQNKAGSISSISLEEKDGNYIYIIDGIDKKGQNIVMTVDSNTSKVVESTPVGPASQEKKSNVLNFTIVKDLKSAIKEAFKKSGEDTYDQIDSYKLMYANNKNIYKLNLSNGETEKDKAKNKIVYVDASDLKLITGDERNKIEAIEKSIGSQTTTPPQTQENSTENKPATNQN